MITGLLHIVRNSSAMFKDIPVSASEMKRQHRGAIRVGQKVHNRVRRRINKKRAIHTNPLIIKGTGGHHQWQCLTCWRSLEGTKQLFDLGEADANVLAACSRGSVSYHSSTAQLTKEEAQYGMS